MSFYFFLFLSRFDLIPSSDVHVSMVCSNLLYLTISIHCPVHCGVRYLVPMKTLRNYPSVIRRRCARWYLKPRESNKTEWSKLIDLIVAIHRCVQGNTKFDNGLLDSATLYFTYHTCGILERRRENKHRNIFDFIRCGQWI